MNLNELLKNTYKFKQGHSSEQEKMIAENYRKYSYHVTYKPGNVVTIGDTEYMVGAAGNFVKKRDV